MWNILGQIPINLIESMRAVCKLTLNNLILVRICIIVHLRWVSYRNQFAFVSRSLIILYFFSDHLFQIRIHFKRISSRIRFRNFLSQRFVECCIFRIEYGVISHVWLILVDQTFEVLMVIFRLKRGRNIIHQLLVLRVCRVASFGIVSTFFLHHTIIECIKFLFNHLLLTVTLLPV